MRLYPVPGGEWAGTEADWKAAMKAKGLNPKEFEATKTREVPTGKKELMEFLTFFAVDVYRTGGGSAQAPVDVEALRAIHNPDGVRPSALEASTTEPKLTGTALDEAFRAAPLGQQSQLAVEFIDNAMRKIEGR